MEPDEIRLMEIIERMPDNLTDMEKVRYIYIEVCRLFVYNPEYITGDNEKKAELFDEDVNLNDLTNNKAICSKLARAVTYLLQACGIESNGVVFNHRFEGHLETVCRVDGKLYELDPARDLMNVKMGFKTQGFAIPMKNDVREDFTEYSYLSEKELEEIDAAIGYTFGLSSEYIDRISERGEATEDYDFKIYMDEAVDEIADALHDYHLFKEYMEGVHPEVDVDNLLGFEQDKYRIEFIMNYVNNFAKDYTYIDRRDFFEELIGRCLDDVEDNMILFSGTDTTGELYTILKYKGEIAENDLFYLIKEGEPIRILTTDEVQDILDNGFKTLAKGKEQRLLSKDEHFKKITYEYGQEINEYLMATDNEDEMDERDAQAFAVILLQRLRKAIADYKEKIYQFAYSTNLYKRIDIEEFFAGKHCDGLDNIYAIKGLIQPLYDSFVIEVNKYGYASYFDEEDIQPDSTIGIEHFLANMKKLEEILVEQAGPVIDIIEDYKAALKEEAVRDGIKLYHVSTISPDKMHGSLRPHYAKTQYHQDFGKVFCASTESIESNPYILARVNDGFMYRLPLPGKAYMLTGGNVSIEKSEDGTSRAVSRVPGYIYYVPIDDFEPMVLLKYNEDSGEYFFEFEEEWTTDKEIRIPEAVKEHIGNRGETEIVPEQEDDEPEVYAIESYTDVTSILEHNQFVIRKDISYDEMMRVVSSRMINNTRAMLIRMLQDGKISYLNGEAGINVIRGAMSVTDKTVITYDAKKILEGPQTISSEDVRRQKIKLQEFVKGALSSGIRYGDYIEIMKHSIEDKSDRQEEQSDPEQK